MVLTAVHTDVVLGPLSRQGPTKLHHARLGSVVARLLLRVVHDAAAHAGNKHNGRRLARSDGGTSNSLRDEERAREVDVDQAAEHALLVRLGGDVAVCDARGVDEHVRGAVGAGHGLHRRVDGADVAHVYLIERHGEAGLGVQLRCGGVAQLLVCVEEGDGFGARLGAGSGHEVAQAAGTAGGMGVRVDGGLSNGGREL